MAKFNPPELALLMRNGSTGLPEGNGAKYSGQIVTVLEFLGQNPLNPFSSRNDYWYVKAVDGTYLCSVEPCLQKLPPPDDEPEKDSDEVPTHTERV